MLLREKPFHNIHSISGFKKFHYGPLLLGVHETEECHEVDIEKLMQIESGIFKQEGSDLILKPIAINPVPQGSSIQVLFKA
jgi:hypothetical protein